MKKVLLSCAVIMAALSVQAQANLTAPAATAPYAKLPVDLQLLPVSSVDKSTNETYYVDYNALNTSTDYVPGTTFYSYFSVNTQAPAIDSLFTEVAVALKPYTGFTDYGQIGASTVEIALGDPGGMLRVDSVFGFLAHSNHSGNENRLIFSLRRGVTYNFTGGTPVTVEGAGNTVVWSDTLKTTSSLSPNQWADGNPAVSGFGYAKEVGITIPVTASSAGVVIQFETQNMGAGDTTHVVVNGNAPSASDPISNPYIWNTTTVSSDSPTQIGLYRISAALWAKVTYTNTVSIKNLEANGFTMHNFMPNPAAESTVISFELKNPADVRFSIVDMAGKQVKLINLNNQSTGTQNYVLNTSDMAVGTYSVSMLVNNKVYTQKLNVVK